MLFDSFYIRYDCILGGQPGNQGKEFIIAFMTKDNVPQMSDIDIVITTTSKNFVTVNVTVPLSTRSMFNESFEIASTNSTRLVYDKQLYMGPESEKSSKAIHISASDDIIISCFSNDDEKAFGFLALPVSIFGKEYFASTFPANFSTTILLVIAVYAHTKVEITLGKGFNKAYIKWNNTNYRYGETIEESLQKLEAWQLVTRAGVISGTRIVGNNPIAVFSGNRDAYTISRKVVAEPMEEMLLPVDRWGYEFVTVPSPKPTGGDIFIITTSKVNTTIVFGGDCNKIESFEEAGHSFQELVPSYRTCSIQADNPISVVQVPNPDEVGMGFSMTILPAMTHYTNVHTINTPVYPDYIYYFMFIIPKADMDGLLVDGASFRTMNNYHGQYIMHNGIEYTAGRFEIQAGSHIVSHTESHVLFGGYMVGESSNKSFALPTAMRLRKNTVCNKTYFVCYYHLERLRRNTVCNKTYFVGYYHLERLRRNTVCNITYYVHLVITIWRIYVRGVHQQVNCNSHCNASKEEYGM